MDEAYLKAIRLELRSLWFLVILLIDPNNPVKDSIQRIAQALLKQSDDAAPL